MDFTYRREGRKAFHEMVEAVEECVRSHGFDVVRCHDLQATLAAKGFEIQPLMVLDVAMPGGASDVCKMHIYTEGDSVWVSAIRPIALWDVTQGAEGSDLETVNESVAALIDEACA